MQIAGTVGLRCDDGAGREKSTEIQLILYMGFLEEPNSDAYSFRTIKYNLNVQDFQ